MSMVFFILSCDKGNTDPQEPSGKLRFTFSHSADDKTLLFDSLYITNSAGNKYLINEIQYFISEVALHKKDGSNLLLNNWKDIHYIDTDIGSTLEYTFVDDIPLADYSGIEFTFGLSEEKNQSLMFVNPPESYMFWPENLGGGYHYMKLNGKWLDTLNQLAPFNFHLGIGQIYYSYPDSITGFVHNYFNVNMFDADFSVSENQTTTINIIMNIENWFTSPNDYDHNYWGGDIMQNQEAMKQATENGIDVFSYEIK